MCKSKTEEFIKRAKKVHGDRYDYSKVKYINSNTKVIIICNKHGDFEQLPNNHSYRGDRCPKCAGKYKTTEEFIKEAKIKHGDKYDYSKVKYINSNTKVIINCNKHGDFEQLPTCHLNGEGCIKCGGNYKPTTEDEKDKPKNENIIEQNTVENHTDIDKYNITKLKELAKEHKIPNYKKYKSENKDELVELIKNKLNNIVSTKLGISVEDRVPKSKINSKLEIFILLKKNNFVKTNNKDYEYYVICGQIGYSNSKSKKMTTQEDYSEIFRIEYTPNTKNLLHRLKEQNYKITYLSNKFNTNISPYTLIEYIREINNIKNNVDL